MANKITEIKSPKVEVREIGTGFLSVHVWLPDDTHFSDGTINNDENVFDSGVLATDETLKVTRGRLIIISMDPTDGNDEDTSYDLTPEDDAVVLKRGSRDRLVAVGLTQYHCEYGPEQTAKAVEEASPQEPAADPAAAKPPIPDAPSRTTYTQLGSGDTTTGGSVPPGEGGSSL